MEKELLRILLVEDSEDDTLLLERELKGVEWEIFVCRVDSFESMKQELESRSWDVVLSDYMIPGFGGMEALELFKAYHLDIPFILISGKITEEMAVIALQEGAQDFVSKQNYARLLPAIKRGIERVQIITDKKAATAALRESEEKYRLLFHKSIVPTSLTRAPDYRFIDVNDAWIGLFGYSREETIGKTSLEIGLNRNEAMRTHIIDQMEKQSSIYSLEQIHYTKSGKAVIVLVNISVLLIENEQYALASLLDITERKEAERNLHNSLISTVRAVSDIVEMRDPYTAGHQKRVASLACAIAKELGMSEDRIEGLELAAQIHDVGKIQIPAEILSKPSQITEIEYMMIKTHPEAGYQILKDIHFPWPIAAIVRQHHEKLDGSGYPHGLKGEEILLESRILTVADIVEAIASHRPYRPALGIDTALEEILKERGSKLDAAVVDTCTMLFKEKQFKFLEKNGF